MKVTQNWCARYQYDDKEPFHFGTVVMPTNAKQHEVESALQSSWDKNFHFPPGKLVALLPGQVAYIPDDGDLEEWARK